MVYFCEGCQWNFHGDCGKPPCVVWMLAHCKFFQPMSTRQVTSSNLLQHLSLKIHRSLCWARLPSWCIVSRELRESNQTFISGILLIPLGHHGNSFWCVVQLSLLILYWESASHCSYEKLACGFLSVWWSGDIWQWPPSRPLWRVYKYSPSWSGRSSVGGQHFPSLGKTQGLIPRTARNKTKNPQKALVFFECLREFSHEAN